MTIQEKIDNLVKSEVVRLVWGKKTIGFRAILFDPNTDKFNYYDFNTKYVKDQEVLQFLVKCKPRVVKLQQYGDLLVSDLELQEKILITELKDEKQTTDVLKKIIKVYQYRKEVEPNGV